MPEKIKTSAEGTESLATQRWQARIRPWMQVVVTGTIVFFLIASGWQIWYIHQRIVQAPELKLDFPTSAPAAEQEQWRSLTKLEAYSIQQRYHQANVILMSRIWTTYLGFVTGMILAIVGAAFILGKLREQSSQISGETEFWKISIASTSPGLVMVVLGTVLMLTTILVHHKMDVKEGAIYVGTTYQTQTSSTTSL
ncbi:MAG: hypothetical protein ONA90_09530, partial [candidate division KSB1 bacterium]|nr:hypothetical protein [candidate division KSB1 bacterium]